jgi:dephospho-CoA kinase
MKKIFFITGASGVGKTTLVKKLKDKYSSYDNWEFLHFDSVGIPKREEMIEKFGSGENWQKETAYEWIKKIITEYNDKDVIIFEGQVNLKFIIDGFTKNSFSNYEIVLIDCNEEVMFSRLIHERKKPELANNDMKNWLGFLRKQAHDFNIRIIDTSDISTEEFVVLFEKILENKKLL